MGGEERVQFYALTIFTEATLLLTKKGGKEGTVMIGKIGIRIMYRTSNYSQERTKTFLRL